MNENKLSKFIILFDYLCSLSVRFLVLEFLVLFFAWSFLFVVFAAYHDYHYQNKPTCHQPHDQSYVCWWAWVIVRCWLWIWLWVWLWVWLWRIRNVSTQFFGRIVLLNARMIHLCNNVGARTIHTPRPNNFRIIINRRPTRTGLIFGSIFHKLPCLIPIILKPTNVTEKVLFIKHTPIEINTLIDHVHLVTVVQLPNTTASLDSIIDCVRVLVITKGGCGQG